MQTLVAAVPKGFIQNERCICATDWERIKAKGDAFRHSLRAFQKGLVTTVGGRLLTYRVISPDPEYLWIKTEIG